MRGNRREGRGPPRPRARPRDGPLKRSMIEGGGERLARQGVMRGNSSLCASPPACRATKFSRRSHGRDVGVEWGALRWPWGGGSGEAQLGLGSGGREGWGLGAETQMLEDPARHERVGESGDAVAAAAARGAAQHVEREGPLLGGEMQCAEAVSPSGDGRYFAPQGSFETMRRIRIDVNAAEGALVSYRLSEPTSDTPSPTIAVEAVEEGAIEVLLFPARCDVWLSTGQRLRGL